MVGVFEITDLFFFFFRSVFAMHTHAFPPQQMEGVHNYERTFLILKLRRSNF